MARRISQAKKPSLIFVGPVYPPRHGGVAIKNRILIDEFLKNNANLYAINTTSAKISVFFRLLAVSVFPCAKIVISVSENGRLFLLPYGYLLTRLLRKRIVFLPGGGGMARQMCALPTWARPLYRRFCSAMVQILPETNGIAEPLRHDFGLENVSVQANFKPRPSVPPSFEQSHSARVVYIGRVVRNKGIFVLMDAVERLHQQGLDIAVDFYGPFEPTHEGARNDAEADRREFQRRTKSNACLRYRGVVEPDKVGETLRSYNIFAFPTMHDEGFPGVLIDAAFAGLPVVATRGSYNAEIVIDGETGLMCEPNDVAGLAAALETLAWDPALRTRMGQRNWGLSVQYDVQNAVQRIMGFLRPV